MHTPAPAAPTRYPLSAARSAITPGEYTWKPAAPPALPAGAAGCPGGFYFVSAAHTRHPQTTVLHARPLLQATTSENTAMRPFCVALVAIFHHHAGATKTTCTRRHSGQAHTGLDRPGDCRPSRRRRLATSALRLSSCEPGNGNTASHHGLTPRCSSSPGLHMLRIAPDALLRHGATETVRSGCTSGLGAWNAAAASAWAGASNAAAAMSMTSFVRGPMGGN